MNTSPSATPVGWLDCRERLTLWALDEAQDLPAENRQAFAAALSQWQVPGGDYVVAAAAALLPVANSLSDVGKARLVEALECVDHHGWGGLLASRLGQAIDPGAAAAAIRAGLS